MLQRAVHTKALVQQGPRGQPRRNKENNFRHAANKFGRQRVGQRNSGDQWGQEANAPFANANSISNEWNNVGDVGGASQSQCRRSFDVLADQVK